MKKRKDPSLIRLFAHLLAYPFVIILCVLILIITPVYVFIRDRIFIFIPRYQYRIPIGARKLFVIYIVIFYWLYWGVTIWLISMFIDYTPILISMLIDYTPILILKILTVFLKICEFVVSTITLFFPPSVINLKFYYTWCMATASPCEEPFSGLFIHNNDFISFIWDYRKFIYI